MTPTSFPQGRMMVHCHILTHEDLGMMMVADAVAATVNPREGMTAGRWISLLLLTLALW